MNLVNQIYGDVKRLEEHVKKSLKKADLMGLVKIGAPSDEYDHEAKKLVELLAHGHCAVSLGKTGKKVTATITARGVEDVVFAVFAGMFGRDQAEKIPRKEIAAVAAAILGVKAR
jgi:hypothetical protein